LNLPAGAMITVDGKRTILGPVVHAIRPTFALGTFKPLYSRRSEG
jgi:hypothetical protein